MHQAVVCNSFGSTDNLKFIEVAGKKLQPNEVRVKVAAAGVNFPDILIVEGKYQRKPELPFSPGFEAAGEVLEVGNTVTGISIGQSVFVFVTIGGYWQVVGGESHCSSQ
jgi:NADPH2:quinone reductase